MEELFVNKFKKSITAIAVVIIAVLTLVSCGGYNFYKDWTNAGATIEKDNVFEVISLEEAKSKIDADETFALLVGTSEAASAANTISIIQSQATYFEFDKKLYYVDATDYLSKTTERKNLRDTLGITDATPISTNIVVVCYTSGSIVLDTSKKVTDPSLESFVSFGSINYYSIAAYLFNDYIFD